MIVIVLRCVVFVFAIVGRREITRKKNSDKAMHEHFVLLNELYKIDANCVRLARTMRAV